MAEARVVKFCLDVDYIKCSPSDNYPSLKIRDQSHVFSFRILHPVESISLEWLKLETSNFVQVLAKRSVNLQVISHSPSGRGPGHVTHFLPCELCSRGICHSHVSMCLCVCLSQVSVLLKWLNIGKCK